MIRHYRTFAFAALAALFGCVAPASADTIQTKILAWKLNINGGGQDYGLSGYAKWYAAAKAKMVEADADIVFPYLCKNFPSFDEYTIVAATNASGTTAFGSTAGSSLLIGYKAAKFVEMKRYQTVIVTGTNDGCLRLVLQDKETDCQYAVMWFGGSNLNFGNTTTAAKYQAAIDEMCEDFPKAILIVAYSKGTPSNLDSFFTDTNGMIILREETELKIFVKPNADSDPKIAYVEDVAASCNKNPVTPIPGTLLTVPFTFTPVPFSYQVTFMDMGGTDPIEPPQMVEKGHAAVAPTPPEHAGFEFVGWDKAFDNITEDTVVTALYQTSGNAHQVSYYDWDGETFLEAEPVEDGETATGPTVNPAHEGHAFVGWLLDGEAYDLATPVTEDISLVANFSINHYDVRFFSEGEQYGEAQSIAWSDPAVRPDDPVSANPDLVFARWDKDFSCVTSALDVAAVFVDREIEVTSANFAEIVTAEIPAQTTCRLVEDVVLDGWTAVDFKGTLDGAGHSIFGLKRNLLGVLRGTVRDVTLDGGADGTSVSLNNQLREDFGLVACTNLGGAVIGVTVRNFTVTRSNGGNGGLGFGLVSGYMTSADGRCAVVSNCVVEASCSISQGSNGNMVGGVIGQVQVAGKGSDDEVARIAGCTNSAAIFAANTVDGSMGGIVGAANGFDTTTHPRMSIFNCINLGCLQGEDRPCFTNASEYLGGILGKVSGDNIGSDKGQLLIAGCRNEGAIGARYAKANCGGMLGGSYRHPEICIESCVNRGTIGNADAGCCGGFAGNLPDSVKGNDLIVENCANYGSVSGEYAGGVTGRYYQNQNAASMHNRVVNFGNYGNLSGYVTNGLFLAWFATDFGGNTSGSFYLQATNCFTSVCCTPVGQNADTSTRGQFHDEIDVVYTPGDSGATKSLSAWAEENGYEPWIQGKVGDKVYPELGIFCQKPYVDGFMMYVR